MTSFFKSDINSVSHYLGNDRESDSGERVGRQVFSVGRKEAI